MLTIPGGLYSVAPSAGTVSGWSTSVTSGSGGAWLITLQAGSQLTAGAAASGSFTVEFLDDINTAPYRAWAGNAFDLAGAASTSNLGQHSLSAAVSQAADTELSFSGQTTAVKDDSRSR